MSSIPAIFSQTVRSRARSLTGLLHPGPERDVVEDLVIALEKLGLEYAGEVVLRLYGQEPSEVSFKLGGSEAGKRRLVLDVLVELRDD